jgi:hypothetical protein
MAIEIQIEGKSITELRQLFDELEESVAAATDPKQMEDFAQAAGKVQNRIQEVDRAIESATAGSPFEAMSKQLGGVGEALGRLDFKQALLQAQMLAATSKSISFKGAISSVKKLGRTLLNLGKSLLTNPFFLIGAVIAAIVIIIVKLMDELGLLQIIIDAVGKYFEFFMDIINGVIDVLKDFTDWLGWTNHAAQEAAEEQAKAAQSISDSWGKMSEGVVQDLDHQIRLRKIEGESTVDLERKKLFAIAARAKLEREALEAQMRAAVIKGDLDEEEMADLQEQLRVAKLAYKGTLQEIQAFDAQVQAEQKNSAEKDQQKRLQAAEKYKKDRIKTEREIQDLIIENMAEGLDKQLAEINANYDRKIEDTKADETLLQKEKDKIIDQFEKQREAKEKAAREAQRDKDEADEIAFQTALSKLKIDIIEDDTQKAKALLDQQQADELKKLKAQFKDHEDYQLMIDAVNEKYRQKRAQADQLESEQKIQARMSEIDTLLGLDRTSFDDRMALLEEQRQLELEQKDLTEAELLAIDEKYSKLREGLIDGEKEKRMKAIQGTLEVFSQGIDAVGALSDFILGQQEENAEEGSIAEERAARERFETNKKLQIGNALIQTAQAAIAAYSSAAAVPVVGPILAPIAATAAVAMGMANVAKISSQKFESPSASSGGGGGATPSGGSTGGATPAYNFWGNPFNQPGGGGDTQDSGMGGKPESQEMIVKAYVLESDITTTQNKISKIQNLAQL